MREYPGIDSEKESKNTTSAGTGVLTTNNSPSSRRRRASLDEAKTILFLTMASSGDLRGQRDGCGKLAKTYTAIVGIKRQEYPP
jgi:hypothetical protein